MIKNVLKIGITFVVLLMFANCKGAKAATNDDIVVTYDSIAPKTAYLPIQAKYAKLLNTKPDSLQNVKLYKFIDKWMNTPYILGGETKEGIDCSSFTQLMYTQVYDLYIERTAEKQFESENMNKFRGQEFLKEGDFIFFQKLDEQIISHVGVYLKNNKFVHSTSHRGKSGAGGVKISDIRDAFWQKRFVAGGKRTDL